MKNPNDVLAARVDHLTRQLLAAQIEQLELQLTGLREQQRLLNGGRDEPEKPAYKPAPGTAAAKIIDLMEKATAPMGLSEITKALHLPGSVVSVTLTALRRHDLIRHYVKERKWGRK